MNPVAATIDGLIGIWDGAAPLIYTRDGKQDAVIVTDGPRLADPEAWRVLAVGTSADYAPGGQSSTRPGFGGRQDVTLQVSCALSVWDGSTDLAGVRSQAYGVLDVLDRLLRADESLDDAVTRARVLRHSYQPVQTDDGVAVLITFVVQTDAVRFEGE